MSNKWQPSIRIHVTLIKGHGECGAVDNTLHFCSEGIRFDSWSGTFVSILDREHFFRFLFGNVCFDSWSGTFVSILDRERLCRFLIGNVYFDSCSGTSVSILVRERLFRFLFGNVCFDKPNVAVERLSLLLRTQQVAGSNLGPGTSYPDWGFSWCLKLGSDRFLPYHFQFIIH
jgi:hypothetical protein